MADRIENTVMDRMSVIDNPIAEPTMKNFFGLQDGIRQLGYLITRQEGWWAKTPEGGPSLTRRTNNPGALMKKVKNSEGKDIYVAREYDTPQEGWNALMTLLNSYSKNNPNFTISDFVNKYVAGGETEAYEKKHEGHLDAYKKAIGEGMKWQETLKRN